MALTPKQKALLNSCPILKEFKDVFEGMSGSSGTDSSSGSDSGNSGTNSGSGSDSGNSGTNSGSGSDSGNTPQDP